MADCFSLPNAVELVEELREAASEDDSITFDYKYIEEIVNAIEALMLENTKLKAERDDAMRTMPHDCNTCSKDCDITIAHKALFTKRCDEWEWRSVKEKEYD